jgi:hypothetical protein
MNMFAFALPRGRHSLEYRAEPFPVLRCVVSVPQDATDTCPLLTAADTDVHILEGVGRYLDFRCTPQTLPTQHVAALETVLQQGLDALQLTTTVPLGARYWSTDGEPHLATAALTATFSYHLMVDGHASFIVGSGGCVTLCNSVGPAEAGMWFVEVHALFGWRFTGAGSAPIDVPALAHTSPDTLMGERVSWQTGWQLGPQPFGNPFLCDAVFGSASALLTASDNGSPLSVSTQAAPNPADGCLYTVTLAADTASTAPAHTSVYLYRFGVLFTVNAKAHALAPGLPVANAEEQALARQLAAQPKG